MSQRLLISLEKNVTKEDQYFDAIYTEKGNLEILLSDWCNYDKKYGWYCGPWKITIRDRDFFDQFMEDFKKLKDYIPKLQKLSDCWAVYDENGDNYTNEEINNFMKGIVNKIITDVKEE